MMLMGGGGSKGVILVCVVGSCNILLVQIFC
jgi:hypothetical protein